MVSGSGKKIVFCGTRGLPARYGGFETAVDEITKRLVAKHVPCEVVCRYSTGQDAVPSHDGRSLVYVKGSNRRALDTFVSAWQTGLYLIKHRREYEHVFWFNNANLPGILLTWLAGIPFSVNTDGLEWRRGKWSWPFKLYYIFASWLIARISGNLISDSVSIQDYYRKRFWTGSHLIPYGSPTIPNLSQERQHRLLDQIGLKAEKYFLQITRIEPDNLPLTVAESFVASRLHEYGYQMVVVGFSHESEYSVKLKSLDGTAGVRVLPAIYDPELLAALRLNCYCYVHGNSVGGTNPALLEAMATCRRVLAIESPFSREVLGETGLFFTPESLPHDFTEVIGSDMRRDQLRKRVSERYSWDAVAEAYRLLANGQQPDYHALIERQTIVRTPESEFQFTGKE